MNLFQAQSLKRNVIPKLISAINQRFDHYTKEFNLYTAMKFIDREHWLDDATFGEEMIDTLTTHFAKPLESSGFQKEKVFGEWKRFKIFAKATYAQNMSTRRMWETAIVHHKVKYPNLMKVISLILSISGSNSQVERTFSVVTNILSDKRLSMNHDTLDDCIVILGNNSLWTVAEKEEIITLAREKYMRKRRIKEVEVDVVAPYHETREDEDASSESDTESDFDSEDERVIEELVQRSSCEEESDIEIDNEGSPNLSENGSSDSEEGETDEDLLSDYERERRRKEHN